MHVGPILVVFEYGSLLINSNWNANMFAINIFRGNEFIEISSSFMRTWEGIHEAFFLHDNIFLIGYKLEENEIFVPSPSPSVHQPVANAPSPFVPPGVHSIPPVVASSHIYSASFHNIIFIVSLVLNNLMPYIQWET